jgi:4,5-dihydroxyphthalate decarboxylase
MTALSRRSLLRAAGALAGVPLGAHDLVSPSGSAGQTAPSPPVITLTCADYVRFMPIATGDVRPDGLTLRWIRGDRNEMLRRATQDPSVDGGESSLDQHVMRIAAGDRSLVAIPVFPLRNFTARDIYVAKGSTLTPQTLNGRRLGIYNWAASGAVWYRHLLRYFKQDPAKISWVVGAADSTAAVNIVGTLPSHVTLAPKGRSLTDLLLAKEIEAIFAPLPPAKYHAADGPLVRLMPDYRRVEQQYFKDTGCYPPQHAVVLRRAVWERQPWIGRRIVDAFQRADEMYHASQRLYPYGSPWLIEEIEQTEREMGARYHAHGLDANRRALDVFCEGAWRDGMTARRVTVDEMFAEFLHPGAAAA